MFSFLISEAEKSFWEASVFRTCNLKVILFLCLNVRQRCSLRLPDSIVLVNTEGKSQVLFMALTSCQQCEERLPIWIYIMWSTWVEEGAVDLFLLFKQTQNMWSHFSCKIFGLNTSVLLRISCISSSKFLISQYNSSALGMHNLQCNTQCITGACAAVQMLSCIFVLSKVLNEKKAGSLISCCSGFDFSCPPCFMGVIFFLVLLCMFDLYRYACWYTMHL